MSLTSTNPDSPAAWLVRCALSLAEAAVLAGISAAMMPDVALRSRIGAGVVIVATLGIVIGGVMSRHPATVIPAPTLDFVLAEGRVWAPIPLALLGLVRNHPADRPDALLAAAGFAVGLAIVFAATAVRAYLRRGR